MIQFFFWLTKPLFSFQIKQALCRGHLGLVSRNATGLHKEDSLCNSVSVCVLLQCGANSRALEVCSARFFLSQEDSWHFFVLQFARPSRPCAPRPYRPCATWLLPKRMLLVSLPLVFKVPKFPSKGDAAGDPICEGGGC
jgi:hypothetical protein